MPLNRTVLTTFLPVPEIWWSIVAGTASTRSLPHSHNFLPKAHLSSSILNRTLCAVRKPVCRCSVFLLRSWYLLDLAVSNLKGTFWSYLSREGSSSGFHFPTSQKGFDSVSGIRAHFLVSWFLAIPEWQTTHIEESLFFLPTSLSLLRNSWVNFESMT